MNSFHRTLLWLLAMALVASVGSRAVAQERMDRGLIAIPAKGGGVYLSWRLLADDPPETAFDVFRRSPGKQDVKLNAQPIVTTTDFLAPAPEAGVESRYYLKLSAGGNNPPATEAISVSADADGCIRIPLQGDYKFQKIGIADLDGDGRYDFVIKQPRENVDPGKRLWKKSPGTYKLEAYSADGKFLWRQDMGWAIEQGIWYSPYVVFDLDGDGKAEVVCKAGEGDPRDPEGRVRSGPEYLDILDGLTGNRRVRIDWIQRDRFGEYNLAARNQLGVALLDGKRPSLIVERGTYGRMIVRAYDFDGSALRLRWEWDSDNAPARYRGQGAHWMHAADVDGDGRDEIVLGSSVIDDNGKELWTTGLGHPDHCYVGDLIPGRPGLEIYYGMEKSMQNNGMCMVDAATGKILWGYDQPTRHVHGRGMCGDIDPNYPGAECYSADTNTKKKFAFGLLHSADGRIIARDNLGGSGAATAYWDADPQRELIFDEKIVKFPNFVPVQGKIEGSHIATVDVLGDWREEIITSVPGEIRIYVTAIPARDRRASLMTDRLYRMDVTMGTMGYHQVPMPSYDMSSGTGSCPR